MWTKILQSCILAHRGMHKTLSGLAGLTSRETYDDLAMVMSYHNIVTIED